MTAVATGPIPVETVPAPSSTAAALLLSVSTHKAGNILLVGVTSSNSVTPAITDNGSTPNGWTQVITFTPGNGTRITLFAKVSDGTGTQITVSRSGTSAFSALYQQWTNVSAWEWTSAGGRAGTSTGVTSPYTFGPTFAPTKPGAIPVVFVAFQRDATGVTPSSGWSLDMSMTAGANQNTLALRMTTPPNAAVSGSVTFAGNEVGGGAAWAAIFLDP